MRLLLTLFVLSSCYIQSAHADIVDAVPQHPKTEQQFVIYLHGRIIEDGDPKPVHPVWGVYDYPAVLQALDTPGRTVISEQRAAGTSVKAYAEKVNEQINTLLAAGVPAKQIAVVGFSKGGAITLQAAHNNTNPQIRFVLLATCGTWLQQDTETHLSGHVLSLYETSDNLASSCSLVAERDPVPTSFEEHAISTGKQHGAFYQPLFEWLKPLEDWLSHNVSVR